MGEYQYLVREVTGTTEYPATINQDKEVYAWSSSGNGYSGWSSATPNPQEPWSEVTSGLGGNDGRPGIWHKHSRSVTARTYQYDLWDSKNNYLGHFPPDIKVGVTFSVFASTRATSSVTRLRTEPDALSATPSVVDKSATISFEPLPRISRLDILNDLGWIVEQREIPAGTASLIVTTKNLPSGVYFCQLFESNSKHAAKLLVRH